MVSKLGLFVLFLNEAIMIRIFTLLITLLVGQSALAQGKITPPQNTNIHDRQEQTSSIKRQHSQSIPTTLAGYTLGRTTRNGAEKYTFDKGYSLSYPGGSKLTAHYVDFSGYIWNDVELYFHNNKLYKIVFSKPDLPSEHKSFGSYTPDSEIFASIYQVLSNKYSKYCKSDGIYDDGKTTISVNSHQLIYTDDALNGKATNAYDSL